MNRSMLIIAFLLLFVSTRAVHAQSDGESGNGPATKECKAMARLDIEALGGRAEGGVIHDNDALARGLKTSWLLITGS